ncbi:response regulator [Metabacillus endolithicus]|uniref:Response regulator n=1 Tax=Metabacillus endolithicus TaxID=1535204 RepID=A0ABW5BYA1_9BACI|nr:response regulator [Metabacillus endolithicus]UPG65582.1 response regulator [Metabacillus endolithicus]
MIRVLVVDDEKIVRKGLISFMPWEDFGMIVVGEANNGEKALEFMETNKVDLLITDLAMPVMSGIELMEEVSQRYPHIQIVVLTLHQDFEYVQKALRMGAVDYIAKTELEKEQFEDVLERIVSLIEQKDSLKRQLTSEEEIEETNDLIVLYALNLQKDEAKIDASLLKRAFEADIGIWYWTDMLEREKESILEWMNSKLEYALIVFQNLKGMDRKSILQLLRGYQKSDLFYDYDPVQPFQIVQSEELLAKEKKETKYDLNRIKEKWLSGEWIYDDAVFINMLHELKAMRMQPIRLTRFFYSLTDEWNRLYSQILSEPITIDDFLSSWFHFEIWLKEIREIIKVINTKTPYSDEIHDSIMRAVTLAQKMIDQPLTAGEIARKVNMSSSYFSQCFKDIIGQTYTDYLREIRMERAKEYLRNSTKTIQWISEKVGYNDEKYFSRLFRDYVGVLPSEYRRTDSKGK